MSDDYVVISKEIRPEFTAELLYDRHPENPRKWGGQPTRIHFWDDMHEEMSDSRDIVSYKNAIYELYQNIYPELAGLCLEDEPPQEVLDLIGQTPYPGALRWIRVIPGSYETSFMPKADLDTEDPRLGGVAFISEENLKKDGLTREEGEIMIQNDLLVLEQYINGNVYLLKIDLDGEEEYHGEIYPLAETAQTAGRMTLTENTHLPTGETLDEHLLEMNISPEDQLLVKTARWNRSEEDNDNAGTGRTPTGRREPGPPPAQTAPALPDAVRTDQGPPGILR